MFHNKQHDGQQVACWLHFYRAVKRLFVVLYSWHFERFTQTLKTAISHFSFGTASLQLQRLLSFPFECH